MKINNFIILNVLHFLFSIFLVISFAVNFSIGAMSFVPEAMLNFLHENPILLESIANNAYERQIILEKLSSHFSSHEDMISYIIKYSIIMILVVFIILVSFRLKDNKTPPLCSENKENKEIQKWKENIQSFLGSRVNIKFTKNLTFAAGRELNIALGDLVKFLKNDKSINFKLYHELHHISSMDNLFALIYEPIINKFCLNIAILLTTAMILELTSKYYIGYFNLVIMILVFISLKKVLMPFRFSYRNIRECAADFYASQKTGLEYQENFLVDERQDEGFHLTHIERNCCCKGDMPYIWKAIAFTFFLLFIFFNPFYSENVIITSIPYIMLCIGGLCCFAFISISKQKGNRWLSFFFVCFLLFALVYVKILIINEICYNFDFNYVKACSAYELF